LSKFAEYWKAIVAVVGAVAVAVQVALTDGTVTSAEWVTIAIAAVTAVGVYLKANAPAGQ
jgi:hypothetical protein